MKIIQALTLISAIAILSILIAVYISTPTLSQIKETIMPDQQTVIHPGQPDYHSVVEGIDVNTYCDRVPDKFEGTCAEFHLQRVAELKDALGIE